MIHTTNAYCYVCVHVAGLSALAGEGAMLLPVRHHTWKEASQQGAVLGRKMGCRRGGRVGEQVTDHVRRDALEGKDIWALVEQLRQLISKTHQLAAQQMAMARGFVQPVEAMGETGAHGVVAGKIGIAARASTCCLREAVEDLQRC